MLPAAPVGVRSSVREAGEKSPLFLSGRFLVHSLFLGFHRLEAAVDLQLPCGGAIALFSRMLCHEEISFGEGQMKRPKSLDLSLVPFLPEGDGIQNLV